MWLYGENCLGLQSEKQTSEYNSEMFTYGKLVCIKCCSLTQSLIFFFFFLTSAAGEHHSGVEMLVLSDREETKIFLKNLFFPPRPNLTNVSGIFLFP